MKEWRVAEMSDKALQMLLDMVCPPVIEKLAREELERRKKGTDYDHSS